MNLPTGRKYAASPTFCSKVPPKAGAVLVEKEKKQHYTMLPRTDCEFQQFPAHKLDTNMWFKVRVIWGYLKIAAFAVIKENVFLDNFSFAACSHHAQWLYSRLHSEQRSH